MSLNPFDMRGPEFLNFYLGLIVLATVAIWLVRRGVRAAAGGTLVGRNPILDPYETAFLAGGGERAMVVAIASLAHRGNVVFRDGRSLSIRGGGDARAGYHAVERALLNRSGERVSLRDARAQLRSTFEAIQRTLQRQGLILSDSSRYFVTALTCLIVGSVCATGVAKIVIGQSRNKPTGYLMAICFVYLTASIVGYARWRLFRTAAGDAMLYRLRSANPKIGVPSPRQADPLPTTLVALYGVDVLSGYLFHDELERTLAANRSNNGSSDTSSGCSSSSCSSSSSCGGGSSGCGGCGGGGGD